MVGVYKGSILYSYTEKVERIYIIQTNNNLKKNLFFSFSDDSFYFLANSFYFSDIYFYFFCQLKNVSILAKKMFACSQSFGFVAVVEAHTLFLRARKSG